MHASALAAKRGPSDVVQGNRGLRRDLENLEVRTHSAGSVLLVSLTLPLCQKCLNCSERTRATYPAPRIRADRGG